MSGAAMTTATAEVLNQLVGIGEAVWRASWQASVLAVLVLLVQLSLGKRISARWRHAMWMLVLVRLALPVVPSSPVSVFNLAPKPVTVSTAIVHADGTPAPGAWMLPVKTIPMAAASAIDGNSSPAKPPTIQPAGSMPGLWTGWPQVLATLWALGAIVLALRVGLATWRVSRTLRGLERVDADAPANAILRATAAELRVRRVPMLLAGDGFFSPALIGCVEPKLIVPRELLDFDRAELRLILLHELAHLKRRDVAISWAATTLIVLHWLNPVAWLVAWRLRIERELACDELVMSAASDTDRRAYGHTIVKLLETFSRGGGNAAQPLPAGGVGILEGGEQMKRRITMIAQFARSNRVWTFVAAALVVALGVVALTDAVKAEPPAKPSATPNLEQRTIKMADGTLVTTNDFAATNTGDQPSTSPSDQRTAVPMPSNEQIAQHDAVMRKLLNELSGLRLSVEQAKVSVGPQHVQVLAANARVRALEDQVASRAEEYRTTLNRPTKLSVGDLVAVSIMDLVGPGVETVKTARIDGDGQISLPYVGRVKAADLTPTELEKAVVGAFRAQGLVEHPVVSVSMPERGESLQMAKRPDAAVGAAPTTPPAAPAPGMVAWFPEDAGAAPAAPAPAQEDEATKAVMGRKLPEVKLDNIPLSDTIDFLRDITSTNIFVNWRALEAAGIDRNSPVTLKLKDVAFRDVLSLIARDQGNGMNFKMENAVIVIDVPVQAARMRKLTTKAYDVLQLLGNMNDGTLPGKMKNLEDVVRTTVQPLSWQDESTGISAFESRLVITATDEVHGEVAQLLKMLEGGDAATTKPSTQRAFFESQ